MDMRSLVEALNSAMLKENEADITPDSRAAYKVKVRKVQPELSPQETWGEATHGTVEAVQFTLINTANGGQPAGTAVVKYVPMNGKIAGTSDPVFNIPTNDPQIQKALTQAANQWFKMRFGVGLGR